MLKNMSIHVNGQDRVPPGFRFHPTEEELLHYYLRKKVSYEKIDMDVICDVDLNMLEPWDIPEKCRIGTAHQNDWYFFSHKDKKYPTGTRTNRATAAGFWKATGRDKVIYSNCKRIGMRKTLVFYRGRAPQGQKSDWIMHEYRLDDNTTGDTNVLNDMGDTTQEEGWVICRLFKKKHFSKTLDSPIISSITTEEIVRTQMLNSSEEGSLEQMVHNYMGNACKEENEANNIKISLNQIATADFNVLHDRFMKLPSLDSPNATSSQTCYLLDSTNDQLELQAGINDWATLDRLIASHLNGQTETSSPSSCFNNEPTSTTMAFSLSPTDHDHLRFPELHRSSFSSTPISDRPPYPSTSLDHHIQNDLWSLITRSFSDSMDQVSNARI